MKTKWCSICNTDKPISEFSKNPSKKGGHNHSCKSCSRSYFKEYYKKNTAKVKARNNIQDTLYKQRIHKIVIESFADGCGVCGETDIRVLEFAHKNKKEKEFSIGTAVGQQLSIVRIKEEIGKCKILCANCHRKETHEETNSWKHKLLV